MRRLRRDERGGILVPAWAEDPCEPACCDDEPPPLDPPANLPFCNCCVQYAELTISGLQDVTQTFTNSIFHWRLSNLNGTYLTSEYTLFGGARWFFRFVPENPPPHACDPPLGKLTREIERFATSGAFQSVEKQYAKVLAITSNCQGGPGAVQTEASSLSGSTNSILITALGNCSGFTSGTEGLAAEFENGPFRLSPPGTSICGLIAEDDFTLNLPGGENGHFKLRLLGEPGDCTTPPPINVTLTQVPPASTTSTSANFGWTTGGNVASTSVRLDGGPPQNIPTGTTHSYTGLSLGTHTFTVTVTDPIGQTDSDTYTWNVTGIPAPTVTLVQTPSNPTTNTSATFAWTTTGQVTTTTCQVDSNPVGSCATPRTYNNLALGNHTFRVTVDGPGGTDTEIYNWTINPGCTPPLATWTSTPPASTADTTATFTWSTTGSALTLTTLRLDGGPLQSPTSSGVKVYQFLTPGPHTVELRVVNACGEHTITYSWTITGAPPSPPTVTLTSTPPNPSLDTSGTFTWTTTGQVDATSCQLDALPAGACTTPKTYTGLALGQHTFRVSVSNSAGSDLKTYTWSVILLPPTVTLTQTPPTSTTNTSATFAWTTSGQVDITECQLDGNPVASCATPRTYTNLAPGPHTFSVTVRNAGGNDTETYSWTVVPVLPPPTVTLTQTPPLSTTSTSGTFAWTTTGQVDVTECQLDGNPVASCATPRTYTNLSVGMHTFHVTVRNASGSDTKSYTWEVQGVGPSPPTVTLTQTPPLSTTNQSGTFAWTTTGQVDVTECQLDGNPVASCSTPRTYTNLSVGFHTFRVTVSNVAGSDTKTYTWEVTLVPPPPTLCDKIVQLMQITGGISNVDVDVTFSGVTASAACQGIPQWNTTFLFPQPHLGAGSCPNVAPGSVQQTQVCGNVLINGQTPTIRWRICTNCSEFGLSGPMVLVRATYPTTDGSGAHWTFVASGAACESLVDQLLATGQGFVPFHSQNNPPVAGQQFDFSGATCRIRIFN